MKIKLVSAYHGRYEQGFMSEDAESCFPHRETRMDTTLHVHKSCSQQGRKNCCVWAVTFVNAECYAGRRIIKGISVSAFSIT
jgi:hypothetical protein